MSPEDTDAFQWIEQLFGSYCKPLRVYARRFVNDTCTAEDIVQDVFCELWTRRASIRRHETESVKSYLFKAVYNRCLNALTRRPPAPDGINERHTIERYLYPYMQNPEQSLLLKELDNEITGFVGTLPPQCRRVFSLSRSSGLKNAEIARHLNISIKAVEKHIGKALRGLKEHL